MQKSSDVTTKDIKDMKNMVHTEIKDIIGFGLFIILFVIVLPVILYKFKQFTLLEVYLPNVDLIANLLTWIGGPYGIWNQLYSSTVSPSWKSGGVTFVNFTTEVLINYIALLGLTFIVAREAVQEKSIFEGWSFAFIMLIITYLLPVPLVNLIMAKVQDMLKGFKFTELTSKLLSGLVGFGITLTFLFMEILIIRNYRKNVVKISKYIYKTPKKIKTLI